jgi:hypothetical protein
MIAGHVPKKRRAKSIHAIAPPLLSIIYIFLSLFYILIKIMKKTLLEASVLTLTKNKDRTRENNF